MLKKNSNVYTPICLYGHSYFLRKVNFEKYIQDYLQHSNKAIILICDDLYAINLMLQDKEHNYGEALVRARKKGSEIFSMVTKVLANQEYDISHIRVVRWKDIAKEGGFSSLYKNFVIELPKNPILQKEMEAFVEMGLRKFKAELTGLNQTLERRYLYSEITMSIYVTELLGYNTEIWENTPPHASPDPIKLLYTSFQNEIRDILKVAKLKRDFTTLSSGLGLYPQTGLAMAR